MLASIPPPPITSFHRGPVRVTVFGLVVAIAVLVGVSVTRIAGLVHLHRRAGRDPAQADSPTVLIAP